MKKTFLFILSITLMSMFNVMAKTIVPTTSTSGNDVWYYIKLNPRNTVAPQNTWASVLPNDTLKTTAYTGGDEQLWKVVKNGDGVALVNKKKGYYVNVDYAMNAESTITPGSSTSTKINLVAGMPTNALRFVPSTAYTYPNAWQGWNGLDAVLIVDNTVTTVSENNEVTFKSNGGAPFSFTFSSMGDPTNCPTSIAGWAGKNVNHPVLFRTQEEVTAEVKLTLSIALTAGNTLFNNSSVGYNPGQFDQDVLDGLFATIESAQVVYDNASSTPNDFSAAATDLYSIIEMFKSQIIKPEISTSSVNNWYYIQGTRPANTYMTAGAAGSGMQVKNLAVIPNATQLWKLVSNGDGFAIQNKATGEYLQTDFATNTNVSTQAAMPGVALQFITSAEASNKSLRFWIKNNTDAKTFILHSNAAGGVMNKTGNMDDNCTWLFLSEDEMFRAQFSAAKQKARALYNSVKEEGTEFGQFSTETRTTFNAAITVEEAKDVSSMSQEELTAASKVLNAAIAAFKTNGEVSTLSSLIEIKWFRLVSNAYDKSYCYNKAMSSEGRNVGEKFTYEEINETSDAQLFRFVLNSDKTAVIAIVNKANGTYVGSDGMILDEMPNELSFDITSLDANSYLIKPVGNKPLHSAQVGTAIVNYDGGAGSASAWRFEFVRTEPVTNLVTPFIKVLATARERYNIAVAYKGTEIGQYTVASMDAYNAIIAIEEAKDPATMTKEQLIAGIEALDSADDGLVINTDIKLLVTSTPAVSQKWFRLVNNMSNDYASGKVMSSNGRLEAEPFTFEDKDENSDAQLFRFELNAGQTNVSNIINKASNLYVNAFGFMMAASTEGNEFAITQLANGRSFWIDPTIERVDEVDPTVTYPVFPLHAAKVGTHIVNWNAGAGSASAWLFEYVKTETINALQAIDESVFKVRINNGVVTIDGTENFEVYSITGQSQNHKAALKSGVYVIKLNNMTKKLVIK